MSVLPFSFIIVAVFSRKKTKSAQPKLRTEKRTTPFAATQFHHTKHSRYAEKSMRFCQKSKKAHRECFQYGIVSQSQFTKVKRKTQAKNVKNQEKRNAQLSASYCRGRSGPSCRRQIGVSLAVAPAIRRRVRSKHFCGAKIRRTTEWRFPLRMHLHSCRRAARRKVSVSAGIAVAKWILQSGRPTACLRHLDKSC